LKYSLFSTFRNYNNDNVGIMIDQKFYLFKENKNFRMKLEK